MNLRTCFGLKNAALNFHTFVSSQVLFCKPLLIKELYAVNAHDQFSSVDLQIQCTVSALNCTVSSFSGKCKVYDKMTIVRIETALL